MAIFDMATALANKDAADAMPTLKTPVSIGFQLFNLKGCSDRPALPMRR